MDAMILAAGLGTRLRPYTLHQPKALVKVGGVPMLELVILRLRHAGVRRLVINIHHFGAQITEYLRARDNFGLEILISDERGQLLDTGGGLKKAAGFFGDSPLWVYNTDVLCDSDISELYAAHLRHNPLVTLLVSHRPTSRAFLVNEQGLLCGWQNNQTGERRISRPGEALLPVAYSCIQVVDPRLFSLMTEQGAFSLTDCYIRLAATQELRTVCDDACLWMDLGRPEHLEAAAPFVADFLQRFS